MSNFQIVNRKIFCSKFLKCEASQNPKQIVFLEELSIVLLQVFDLCSFGWLICWHQRQVFEEIGMDEIAVKLYMHIFTEGNTVLVCGSLNFTAFGRQL
jgi:hypothetical protein